MQTYLDSRNSKEKSGDSGQTTTTLTNSPALKFGSVATSESANSLTTGGLKFGGTQANGSGLGAGFNFGSTTVNSSSNSQPAGSGFQLGSSTQSSGTGFKFGLATTTNSDSQLKTSTQSSGTGFKFGSAATTSSESQFKSGFSFGNSLVTTSSQSSGGGFQFGNAASVSSASQKPTESGFKLGNNSSFSASDAQSKGLDFQFGKTVSSASSGSGFVFGNPTLATSTTLAPSKGDLGSAFSVQNSVPNFGSANTVSLPVGGFNFGQKSESEKDPLKATLSVPGGFNFKSALSTPTTTATSLSQTGFTASTIGGFNFSANKTNTSTVNSIQTSVSATSSVGGFTFTAKAPTGKQVCIFMFLKLLQHICLIILCFCCCHV